LNSTATHAGGQAATASSTRAGPSSASAAASSGGAASKLPHGHERRRLDRAHPLGHEVGRGPRERRGQHERQTRGRRVPGQVGADRGHAGERDRGARSTAADAARSPWIGTASSIVKNAWVCTTSEASPAGRPAAIAENSSTNCATNCSPA
jgi:hypothetical protein